MYRSILLPYICPLPYFIGVADGRAGPAFAGSIISAVAARDHAVLQFYSIMCDLGCVIVVTTQYLSAAFAKMMAEIETGQTSRTSLESSLP